MTRRGTVPGEGTLGYPNSRHSMGKGKEGVLLHVCVCLCEPTSIIRHRSLFSVPLVLKDNVAKLKHSRHHFQHGYRKKNKSDSKMTLFQNL